MPQLVALLVTLGLELAVALAARPELWRPVRLELARWVGLVAAASLLTHPFAWWVNGHLELPFWWRAGIIESGVVAAEAALFWRVGSLGWRRALATSFATNAVSFGVGLALYDAGIL